MHFKLALIYTHHVTITSHWLAGSHVTCNKSLYAIFHTEMCTRKSSTDVYWVKNIDFFFSIFKDQDIVIMHNLYTNICILNLVISCVHVKYLEDTKFVLNTLLVCV